MGLSTSSSRTEPDTPEGEDNNSYKTPEPNVQLLTAPPCPDVEDEAGVGEEELTRQLNGETHALVGLKVQQMAVEWMTAVAFRALFPARRMRRGGGLGASDRRAVRNVVDALSYTHGQVARRLQEQGAGQGRSRRQSAAAGE